MNDYTLSQFEQDKAAAAKGVPRAAFRCSQYYLRDVLPAKWRSLKLWARQATIHNARSTILYNTWGIHKTWEYIWHYFWIAWNNAIRLGNDILLKKLGVYKNRLDSYSLYP